MAERRAAFDAQPTVDNFRSLRGTVAETDRDAAHTEWALAVMCDRTAWQEGFLPHPIDALVLAGRDGEAWQTGLARLEELPARQRVELLELRRRTHPADVREPYQALIDAQVLDSYDKRRYDKAITLLRSLRETYTATDEIAQFDAYPKTLRVEHLRRPTFLAKLDAARLQPDR